MQAQQQMVVHNNNQMPAGFTMQPKRSISTSDNNKFIVCSLLLAIFYTVAVATPGWYHLEAGDELFENGVFRIRSEDGAFSINCPIKPFSCTVQFSKCVDGAQDREDFWEGSECSALKAAQTFSFFSAAAVWLAFASLIALRAQAKENRRLSSFILFCYVITVIGGALALISFVAFAQEAYKDTDDHVDRYYFYSFYMLAVTAIFYLWLWQSHRKAAARAEAMPARQVGAPVVAAQPMHQYPPQQQQQYPPQQQQYPPQQYASQQYPPQQQPAYAPQPQPAYAPQPQLAYAPAPVYVPPPAYAPNSGEGEEGTASY